MGCPEGVFRTPHLRRNTPRWRLLPEEVLLPPISPARREKQIVLRDVKVHRRQDSSKTPQTKHVSSLHTHMMYSYTQHTTESIRTVQSSETVQQSVQFCNSTDSSPSSSTQLYSYMSACMRRVYALPELHPAKFIWPEANWSPCIEMTPYNGLLHFLVTLTLERTARYALPHVCLNISRAKEVYS